MLVFTLSGSKYKNYRISNRLRLDMKIVADIADNICAKFFCVPQNLSQFMLFFSEIFFSIYALFCAKFEICCDFHTFSPKFVTIYALFSPKFDIVAIYALFSTKFMHFLLPQNLMQFPHFFRNKPICVKFLTLSMSD